MVARLNGIQKVRGSTPLSSILIEYLIFDVTGMKLLDVVALLKDLSQLNLYRGQVGTIVEEYEPGVFEVEFSDTTGRAYAIETLEENQLMVLHHEIVNTEKVTA